MQAYFISWQWILSFGLAMWFLFIHSPPVLKERDVLHRPDCFLHLAGAYVLYAACLHNTFYNPFLVRNRHALVGQVGLLCGAVGFLFGVVTVISTWDEIDRGFAIGITVGGILQMELQYSGYRAIQQYKEIKEELRRAGEKAGTDSKVVNGTASKNGSAATPLSTSAEQEEEQERTRLSLLPEKKRSLLRKHVGYMVALLVNGCGMPATMRVLERIGLGLGVAPLVLALGVLHVLKESHVKSISAHLPPEHGKKE